MSFEIDPRILSTCFHLGNWSLSNVLLKNNAHFAWAILVPRENNLISIDDLSVSAQHLLMDEIQKLSKIIKNHFNPDKINIGILGNIVPQLHIHVVGRFINDPLWPHGIWQENQPSTPYSQEKLAILKELQEACS